jgi:amino acid adenylation domain-containing protein
MPFRYYPLAQIQQDQGGQPLFETVFNFTNFHVFETLQELHELEVLEANLYAETNLTFWANFSLDLHSSKIILILNGDAHSLSERQMEDIAGYYARTLEAMSHEPDASIASHSPLSAEERQQMLLGWNNARAEHPREDAIHQLFESQVERTPDEIAIVCADEKVTYGELNRRANQLARRLRSLGVGPEIRVGICTSRSVEMVVGLLGVLKAGGAYVALDLAYPKDRLAFMLEDAQVSVLVVQRHVVDALPPHQAQIVCLDSDWERIGLEDARNLPINVAANNLAYVIYTSGSTGTPKGVAVEHRSALTFLHWARTVFAPEDLAGVLASTSICFDLSVFELFAPLSWGGKIFLVENALHLASVDRDRDVRLINTVPSAMAELVNLKAVPGPVRTVNLAGEALHNKLVQQLYEQGTIEQVFNLYGPSEDTTYSTFALMKRGVSEEPTIGRPIVNTQVYLLDAWRQPVPVGAAGELHIGGDGLARGYLNRPEMTAEKFIPDPFGGGPGARLYRTGDLARYLPDGNLEFLGRIDHQVKVRGFRIELGEIEAALVAHPAVREAVVLARDDGAGERRLVAYVIPDRQSEGVDELRGFLKERLPDYMIPSTFVMLDGLPLTPNGKVDRRALGEIDKPAPESGRVSAPPRDLLEFQLVLVWESVLNKRPISITDNFFDLGGHSLLAVRLVAQIKDKLRYNLPLSALVRSADIENLARVLRQQTGSKSESLMVALQPGGSKQPFFCVHPIGGNVLCYMDLARLVGTDRPFYGLQAAASNGQGKTFARIEDMAAYYIEAIRAVQPAGPYLLGGWSFGGVVAFEMARQLDQQDQQSAHVVMFDTWAPAKSRKPDEVDFSTSDLVARFLTDIAGISSKEMSVDQDLLRQLDTREQLRCILEQATRHNILPADMEVEQLAALFDIFERNARAFQAYSPQAYSPQSLEPWSRIILFRASDGKNELLDGPTLGWDQFLLDRFEVRNVSGDHYTMLAGPNARALAEQLRAYLDSAGA